MTKWLSQQITFVLTKLLSLQKYLQFCRDKRRDLSQQTFCRDRNNFVATKHKHVYRDKRRVLSHQTRLLRQKWYLWQFPPTIPTQPWNRWLQFVCDYVKHVGPTHPQYVKKKKNSMKSSSRFHLAQQVHLSCLSLYAMGRLKKTTTQNKLVFGQTGITFSGTFFFLTKLHFFTATVIFVLGLICGIKGCMWMK